MSTPLITDKKDSFFAFEGFQDAGSISQDINGSDDNPGSYLIG